MTHRRRTDSPAALSAEPAVSGDGRSTDRALALDLSICNPINLPYIRCARHQQQPSAYWVCWHIENAGAPASLRMEATPFTSGLLLCEHCARHEMEDTDPSQQPYSTVRLACPVCCHAAGLIDSPEVKP